LGGMGMKPDQGGVKSGKKRVEGQMRLNGWEYLDKNRLWVSIFFEGLKKAIIELGSRNVFLRTF